MCLTYLPSTVREAVHFIAFKHLGRKLADLLVDNPDVPYLNYYSLKDMREDLNHFDDLANRWYVFLLFVKYFIPYHLLAQLVDLVNAFLSYDSH